MSPKLTANFHLLFRSYKSFQRNMKRDVLHRIAVIIIESVVVILRCAN